MHAGGLHSMFTTFSNPVVRYWQGRINGSGAAHFRFINAQINWLKLFMRIVVAH